MSDQTPREEFESIFGPITDDQWQALKIFVFENYTPNVHSMIRGVRIGDKVFHPSEVEFIMREGS